MKATPINRRAQSLRASPVLGSSQRATVLAPISIRLSSPKPTSATETAAVARKASTMTRMVFQLSVIHSRVFPPTNEHRRVIDGGHVVILAVHDRIRLLTRPPRLRFSQTSRPSEKRPQTEPRMGHGWPNTI